MSTFAFDGLHQVPGLSVKQEVWENEFLWHWWTPILQSGLLDGASRDLGNTGETDTLRAGLLLGKVTATNKYKEWTPAAVDGSQYIAGILHRTIKVTQGSTDKDRLTGPIVISGPVKPNRLINPGTTTLGIAGEDEEFIIYAQLQQNFFMLDQRPGGFLGGNAFGGWKDVVDKITDYTVVEADNNVLFTASTADVEFTLPVTAKKGLRYGFYQTANFEMLITAGTVDTLVAFNNAAADGISYTTTAEQIGGYFEVIGNGTKWLTIVGLGIDTQTPTIISA